MVCSNICEHYAFDYFAYIAQIPTSFVDPHNIYIHGYPTGWWRRYRNKKYITTDPMIRHCAENITPVGWERMKELSVSDKDVARLMREASSYGLRNGLSIPIHSNKGDSAVMNFSVNREDSKTLSHIHKATPDLYLLSAYMHEAVMRIVDRDGKTLPKKILTARERECLIWVAEGETTWDISSRLEITESTVIFHLHNIMKKLNASNRQQAVARAVQLGLIAPGFK